MHDKICPIPWNHISIQQNGDYRMCCQCVDPPFAKLKDDLGITKNVKNISIQEIRNSELLVNVRKQMLEGLEPAECNLCWREEKLGFKSKRLHMLQEYSIDNIIDSRDRSGLIDTEKFPIRYIDLRFGNLCNLRCVTCGPSDSSQWYDDYVNINQHSTFNFYNAANYNLEKINNTWTLKNEDFSWYESENFWIMIEKILPNVDRLYLTGGEPWINKAQWKLLEMCVSLGCSQNIILEYNSNLTKIPVNAFDLWSKFKFVNIGCSIDAIGDLAHFIRYPSEWSEVEANVLKLGNCGLANMMSKFSPTISVFNVLGFLDVTDWLHQNKFSNLRRKPSYHLLQGPDYMNLTVLPKETKQWITSEYNLWLQKSWRRRYVDAFDPILKFMNSQDNSHKLPNLKYMVQKLEASRNQKLVNYLPWLSEILGKID